MSAELQFELIWFYHSLFLGLLDYVALDLDKAQLTRTHTYAHARTHMSARSRRTGPDRTQEWGVHSRCHSRAS